MVRISKKGGIDWYRYQKKILEPKLIPFALECKKTRPNTVVQEDKAPAHASKHQAPFFDLFGVERLPWPGNSPDCNEIEPCWPWMKRWTSRFGAPRTRAQARTAWLKCWNEDLTQDRIQKWIERLPRHIQEIIALQGGNEYREGRTGGAIRPYDSKQRRLDYARHRKSLGVQERRRTSIR